MSETIVIQGQQQSTVQKQPGVIDEDSLENVRTFYLKTNLGYYGGSTRSSKSESSIGNCWGNGAPCIHVARVFVPASTVRGLPKVGMFLSLLVLRLFWFVAMVVGTVVGTLLTFRLVRPELILHKSGPGFAWTRIGKNPSPTQTAN